MPTELGLDRLGDGADRLRESDFLELRDHHAARELAEVAAVLLRRAVGVLFREFLELRIEFLSRRRVELRLERADFLEGCRFFFGRLGVFRLELLEQLGGVFRVVLRILGRDFALEHLLDEDAVAELGESLFAAERMLGCEFLERFGRIGRTGHRGEEFALASLEFLVRDRVAEFAGVSGENGLD